MGLAGLDRVMSGFVNALPCVRERTDEPRPRFSHATHCAPFSRMVDAILRGHNGRRANDPAGAGMTDKRSGARPVSTFTNTTVQTEGSALTRYSELMRQTSIETVRRGQRIGATLVEPLLSLQDIASLASRAARDAEAKVIAPQIDALHTAWPKGMKHATKAFIDTAERLQDFKTSLFLQAERRPDPALRRERLQGALEVAEQMHGTPGHTANRLAVAAALLETPAVQQAVGDAAPILEAARWLSLADRDIPVALLAGKRRFTDIERAQHVVPRMANSARLYRQFGLGDESHAQLIEQVRRPDRPVAAQFIDLVDRLAALAAKPYFRDGDKVNVDKVFKALQDGMAEDGLPLDPALLAALRARADDGLLDQALAQVRKDDLYVR